MDTVASPPGGDLKLIWADAAEVAVATGSIVKAFDVVEMSLFASSRFL